MAGTGHFISVWKAAVAAGVLMAAVAAGALTVRAVAQEPSVTEPHLAGALAALNDARSALSETSPNKGGHPQKAMALIAQAEAEIRAVAP